MKKIMYVSGKGRKKIINWNEKQNKLTPYTYEYYTRLIRNTISTKKPVSNNITNRYLTI